MASAESQLDWQSNQVDIRLNPRWPKTDYQNLFKLAENVSRERNLQAHIWVATSGSTAENVSGIKLVALAKEAFLHSARAVNAHLSASAQDIWAQVLPLSHVGGLGIEARAFLSGSRVVQGLKEQKWDARHYFEVISREKCSLSALVPTQIYDLLQLNLRAPSSLRAMVIGGGAFSPELYVQARKLGWPVLPSYGMTETCSQIATAALSSLVAAADPTFPQVGLLSHARARTNAEGFLEVSANSLFTCYAQLKQGQAHHWDPKQNNWFTTEDKGSVVDGALQISGRGQDYIKIGGEAVLLSRLREKLEQAVSRHNPGQAQDFALLAMPSERLENEIQLVFTDKVTLSDASQVQNVYDNSVLPYERVRRSQQINEIPRSELGKILYAELRKKL